MENYEELKRIYCNDLWNDIKKHWLDLNEDKISFERPDRPWFGDILYCGDQLKKNSHPSIYERFPSVIKEHLPEAGYELHNLLPQTDLVKTFLPVLLTSYITHYPHRKNFLDLLDQDNSNTDFIEKGKKLWITPPLHVSYNKLTAADCNPVNIERTLPVYLRIIQFLVFLVNTAAICNVGLSFFLFEEMTGYLHLLGEDAKYYLELLGTMDIEHHMTTKSKYDEEIIEYSKRILSDLNLLKYAIVSLDTDNDCTRPFSFLVFLANLGDELSPSDALARGIEDIDPSDPKQCHWVAQLLDRINFSTHNDPNAPGIIDLLPADTKKLLQSCKLNAPAPTYPDRSQLPRVQQPVHGVFPHA